MVLKQSFPVNDSSGRNPYVKQPMSTEVFISYAAKDRTRVLDLVERLRAAGVSL